jgi:hypothetical protein
MGRCHGTSDVIARRTFLRLGWAALAWPAILTAGRVIADTLAETLAELEQKTREYEDTLTRLLAREEQAVVRATATAERYRTLHAEGLVSRRDLEEADQAVAEARGRLDETRRQLADSQRIVVESAGAPAPGDAPPRVPGRGAIDTGRARVLRRQALDAGPGRLEQFFAVRFGRFLPVSALGQTPLHDRLGFDHRNAVDVALHPDSIEGRALLDHLRARGIPFLAFRGSLAGASTGPHVHVGAASPRTN